MQRQSDIICFNDVSLKSFLTIKRRLLFRYKIKSNAIIILGQNVVEPFLIIKDEVEDHLPFIDIYLLPCNNFLTARVVSFRELQERVLHSCFGFSFLFACFSTWANLNCTYLLIALFFYMNFSLNVFQLVKTISVNKMIITYLLCSFFINFSSKVIQLANITPITK